MLANDGEYRGVRVLKPETLDRMRQTRRRRKSAARGSSFRPGPDGQPMGFGLGFSLVIDDTKQRPGNGTFSWNGIAGTEFWVDPKNDVVHGLHDPGPRAARRIPAQEPQLDIRFHREKVIGRQTQTERAALRSRPFSFVSPPARTTWPPTFEPMLGQAQGDDCAFFRPVVLTRIVTLGLHLLIAVKPPAERSRKVGVVNARTPRCRLSPVISTLNVSAAPGLGRS